MLLTLVVLLTGLWALALYVSRVLHADIEQVLGEQQLSAASLLAADLNDELEDRLHDLSVAATTLAPLLNNDPTTVQARLQGLPILGRRFNGGVFVTDAQGKVIADMPAASSTATRLGADMHQRDAIAAALGQGKSAIGLPTLSPTLKTPVFDMAHPIRDAQGHIIGSLAGVTNLANPSFLDHLGRDDLGTANDYLLVDRRGRRIVTATDHQRIMEASPPPGAQPAIDRFLAGEEGSAVFVNPLGVEIIQSVRQIPLANWYVAATRPTAIAFAPIHSVQKQMLAVTLLLSLLACGLTWWLLRRELSPLFDTVQTLTGLTGRTGDEALPKALPITRNNEIGQLIHGFNHLLHQLAQRQQRLYEKSERFDEAQTISLTGSWALTMPGPQLESSNEMYRLLGLEPQSRPLLLQDLNEAVHPDDKAMVERAFQETLANRVPYNVVHRILTATGQLKWLRSRVAPEFDAAGNLIRAIGTAQDISEQKRVADALEQARRQMDSIIRNIPAMVFLKRADDLRFELLNHAGEELLGHPASTLLGKNDHDLFPREQAEAFMTRDREVLAGHEVIDIPAERITTASGEERVLYTRKVALHDNHGQPTHLLGISLDITERKRTEAELRIAAIAFESQEGMLITDVHGLIQRVNRAFTKITGYTAAEVLGKTPAMLRSGRYDDAFYQTMWQTISATGGWQGEVWDRHKDGHVYPCWLSISVVRNEEGEITHYVGTQHDISDRKQSEERINQLAYFDQLTGLPNRALLLDRLKQSLATSVRNQQHGALLFIDLDKFKVLNDTQGHDQGDLLLKQVAQRLTHCVRAGDTVARLGGDEFVIMLTNLSNQLRKAATQTEIVGQKILAELRLPYVLGETDFYSTASVGATLYGNRPLTVDNLLKQADLAMYKAKSAGRNALCFFDPTMEIEALARAAMESDLRRAINEHQFQLHYQAQMSSGMLSGSEVLVRWQHPSRGLVPPVEFIPLAEETGLILPLGEWILETACQQLAEWAGQPGFSHLTLAVNISAPQFHNPEFTNQVRDILARTGAPPGLLKLELTESLLVDDLENVSAKMKTLRDIGIQFSLDDFGTGYSSLHYLKHLPLNQLKIDRSFVRDILEDPNDAAIARTIVSLAQNLGLTVIAEGVENQQQIEFLTRLDCHNYQGYFFSKPLPTAQFEDYVRSRT